MSEEFHAGVCGGNWWINPSTNLFRSSPCASASNGPGSFGWLSHDQPPIGPNTTRSGSDDSAGSTVVIDHDDRWNQNLMDDSVGKQGQDYSNHILLQQNYSSMDTNNYGQNSFQFMNSTSSYGYNNSPSLLQTLFDTNSQPNHHHQHQHQHQHQQPLLDQSTNYLPCPEYSSPAGFHPSMVNKIDSKPSNNHLQFTNNMTFWSAMTPNFLPPTQPQSVLRSKPNLHGLTAKRNNQESKKGSNEPSSKRSRTETPSPLLAFKVRKEKLGDRITALQQLVSPFGKTDTASVLHEAIEYIKFLHNQVGVLSTPYLKNGSTQPHHHHQPHVRDETKSDRKGETHDLRSLGLCLVPISSTFPVGAETAADFWTPTFGGCFR